MRKFVRGPEPEFLTAHGEAWGIDWEKRRARNLGTAWTWHQVGGVSVNRLLIAPLKQQTQEHCAFCDAYPFCPPSDETIEHFRPKAQFPREAYHWPNLYLCCRYCQQKEGSYSDDMLRPDAADYQFDRYFHWDFTCGMLKVNPQAVAEDQRRAANTIRYFRLNEGHPLLRLREQRKRMKDPEEAVEDFAYRHFLEA